MISAGAQHRRKANPDWQFGLGKGRSWKGQGGVGLEGVPRVNLRGAEMGPCKHQTTFQHVQEFQGRNSELNSASEFGAL